MLLWVWERRKPWDLLKWSNERVLQESWLGWEMHVTVGEKKVLHVSETCILSMFSKHAIPSLHNGHIISHHVGSTPS